jgi:hypothetical protein
MASLHRRRQLVRSRPRGYPKLPDLDFIDWPSFFLVPPVLAVGWVLSTVWFRGSYNVVVLERGGGRPQKLVQRETFPDKQTAQRRVAELERSMNIERAPSP